MDLKELKEYRDVLISQLSNDEFVENSNISSYMSNVHKLTKCLTDIKEYSKKIKQFQGEYRWLSNFHPCKIVYDNIEYPSNEHFYQAMKTTDNDERLRCSKLKTAAESKAFGNELKGKERYEWDLLKEKVMYYGLTEKFKTPYLRQRLLDTKNLVIEEGNNWNDIEWGICLKTREGENRLGKLLMKLRAKILKEENERNN